MSLVCAGCGAPLVGREPVKRYRGDWVHDDQVCKDKFIWRLLGEVDFEPDDLEMIDDYEAQEHAWEMGGGDWRR